jgi:hypothetical protein
LLIALPLGIAKDELHCPSTTPYVLLPWQLRMCMNSLIAMSDQNSNISNQNTQQITKIAAVIRWVAWRSFSRPLRCAPRRSHSLKNSIIAFVVASVMFVSVQLHPCGFGWSFPARTGVLTTSHLDGAGQRGFAGAADQQSGLAGAWSCDSFPGARAEVAGCAATTVIRDG